MNATEQSPLTHHQDDADCPPPTEYYENGEDEAQDEDDDSLPNDLLDQSVVPTSTSDEDDGTAPLPSSGMNMKLYWTFFILGAGSLCPWMSLIQAADYFGYLHPGIEFYISTYYMVGNLVLFVAGILIGEAIPARWRAISGFASMFACMAALPIGEWAFKGSQPLILVVSTLLGALEALVGSTLVSIAGMLWPECIHAWVNGQSAIGVVIALLRVSTKLAFDDTPEGLEISSYVYMIIAAVLELGCLACWFYFERLPAVARALEEQALASPQQRYGKNNNSSTATTNNKSITDHQEITDSTSLTCSANDEDVEEPGTVSVSSSSFAPSSTWDIVKAECWRILLLWWGVRVPCALIVIVFVVALAIIPGLIVQIPSQHGLGSWLPVILIALFNLFDWIGRVLANWAPLRDFMALRSVVIWSIARVIFIPLFILAAISLLPPLALLDFYSILLTVLLAGTTGFLCSVIMMQGLTWSNVAPGDAQTSMTLISFSLILGLTIGSFVGLLISKVI